MGVGCDAAQLSKGIARSLRGPLCRMSAFVATLDQPIISGSSVPV